MKSVAIPLEPTNHPISPEKDHTPSIKHGQAILRAGYMCGFESHRFHDAMLFERYFKRFFQSFQRSFKVFTDNFNKPLRSLLLFESGHIGIRSENKRTNKEVHK